MKNPKNYKAQRKWLAKHLQYANEYYHKNKSRYAEKQKEYRQNNRKKINERSRKWALAHPEVVRKNGRRHHLMKTFKLSLDDYNKLLLEQNSNCAICEVNQSRLKNPLSVDHSHTTGKVRGLLCMVCNFLLGYSKENIDILHKTEEYIKKYSLTGKTLSLDSKEWEEHYKKLSEEFGNV